MDIDPYSSCSSSCSSCEDSSDEEFYEDCIFIMNFVVLCEKFKYLHRKRRASPWSIIQGGINSVYRCRWDIFVKQLIHDDSFIHHYKMSYPSFMKLVGYLSEELQFHEVNSYNRTGHQGLSIEMRLGVTIRFLCGAKWQVLVAAFQISPRHLRSIVKKVMKAIDNVTEMNLKFPSNSMEWEKIAAEFKTRSFNGVFAGCVGIYIIYIYIHIYICIYIYIYRSFRRLELRY